MKVSEIISIRAQERNNLLCYLYPKQIIQQLYDLQSTELAVLKTKYRDELLNNCHYWQCANEHEHEPKIYIIKYAQHHGNSTCGGCERFVTLYRDFLALYLCFHLTLSSVSFVYLSKN